MNSRVASASACPAPIPLEDRHRLKKLVTISCVVSELIGVPRRHVLSGARWHWRTARLCCDRGCQSPRAGLNQCPIRSTHHQPSDAQRGALPLLPTGRPAVIEPATTQQWTPRSEACRSSGRSCPPMRPRPRSWLRLLTPAAITRRGSGTASAAMASGKRCGGDGSHNDRWSTCLRDQVSM